MSAPTIDAGDYLSPDASPALRAHIQHAAQTVNAGLRMGLFNPLTAMELMVHKRANLLELERTGHLPDQPTP